jgi:hypothetical protein
MAKGIGEVKEGNEVEEVKDKEREEARKQGGKEKTLDVLLCALCVRPLCPLC